MMNMYVSESQWWLEDKVDELELASTANKKIEELTDVTIFILNLRRESQTKLMHLMYTVKNQNFVITFLCLGCH